MSNLPTLLQIGFVVPNDYLTKSEKEAILNMRSIDYIINFISDRTPISTGSKSKILPKGIGSKVIVLKSQTGSGKSTVLAPFLYKTFQSRVNKNIAITQPRILTAIDICVGLPDNYDYLKLDVNLGYKTGDYARVPKDKGIIFMTTGILLQQLKVTSDDKFIMQYSFILIDEVHDRSVDVDMSLFLLKKFLINNYDKPDCPMIILMSATFNPNIFMDYFDVPKENLINVIGSAFTIEQNFLKYDTHDYITNATDIAEHIHINNLTDIDNGEKSRDILIFVSGNTPSTAILEKLHQFNSNILSQPMTKVLEYIKDKKIEERVKVSGGADIPKQNYYIAPIELSGKSFYSSGIEYQNLFSNINDILIPIYKINDKGHITDEILEYVKPTRRIIVSTNIAETGVTIETLKYCIDTGFVTINEFNPDFGINALYAKHITKGMATQRRGRVGRKAPGFWFPCYTEDTFKEMPEDQFADILLKDITESLLNILVKETETTLVENQCSKLYDKDFKANKMFYINKVSNQSCYYYQSLKPFNLSSVDYLESPSASSLNYAIEKLHGLGFIDSEYKPTRLGMTAFKFRKVSIENRRMLLAGYSYGANVLNLITIVAFLEVEKRNIFHRKYKPINMNVKKLTESEYEFYSKIIIADEMIEYIMIWDLLSELLDGIIDKIKKIKNKLSIKQIEEWCITNYLKYEGIMDVILYRDELIENFVSMGINPYYNGLNIKHTEYNLLNIFRQNLEEFIGEVKKIKQCIHDGYRFNLCLWDNKRKTYILHHRNIPITIRSNVNTRMGDDAKQTNPNYIILSNIMLRENLKNPGMYELESSGAVSIMDSYVNIDLNFFKH